ncbi:antibiotic biosynthesis monooxygenase [Acetobacteraceae bacterium]|nr:antibiotic biosynthesis monooxygenase [Acetobacteraceae bacterium]
MVQKSLYAVITALPGKEGEIARLLNELAVNVRAEPGCVRFEPYQLSENPLQFHIEETYKDEGAFQAHMATKHGKIFNKTIKDLVEGGASKVIFLQSLEH